MTPRSKEIVAGVSMLIFMIILLLMILASAGCTSVSATRTQVFASHSGVDAELAAAHSSQREAVKQIHMIERSVNDPILKKQVDDLQQTISDLGTQLDASTGKISWYESQYQSLYSDNATAHKQLDTAVAYGQAEHKARVASDKRADVVIYIFALAVAIATFRVTMRAAVTPVSGFAGLIVPGVAFAMAFAAAYGFAYYTLNFLGRFLPDFSWLQHKI